jgi:ribonuclease HI
METLACGDGVALAEEIGVQRVQVETDSQKLVKLWEAANI